MHADVTPGLVEVGPGEVCTLSVRISNSTALIDAYDVSLFGLDPSWVTVSPPRLSLFPDESGEVEISVHLPATFPAGHRQLSVHVRSENDPANFALTSLGMVALGQHRLRLRIDPAVVTAGSSASFGLVLNNDGNTVVNALADASDPEEMTRIVLAPAAIELQPGQQDVIHADVSGKRPWFGQPKVRVITFAVDSTTHVEGIATFIQRPRISRWVLSLMGLLAAAAVFAAVLSKTFDSVVDEASVDKELLGDALDDEAATGNTLAVQPSSLAGAVQLFSNDAPVAGVQVDLFAADDVKVPIATAATSEDGTYSFTGLSKGTYKIRYTGAGFDQIWYLSGRTAVGALKVELATKQEEPLQPVKLGGRPGSVAGTVEADDPTDITATLVVPGAVTDEVVAGTESDKPVDAKVLSVDVSADGTFLLENVPSPATYQLIVSKPGYATETRDLTLGPAQAVDNVAIVLRKGDGTIRGRIETADGPLGGVTIEATDGVTTVSTVSLTEGADVGSFALRSLATPQLFTLTISSPNYRTETRTVSLEAAQTFDAQTIVLELATGSIGGTVSQIGVGPIGGVAVTVASGDTSITTYSASTGEIGSYRLEGLPIPATYTLTFARDGLVPQVRVQDLDASTGPEAQAIDVAMPRSTATVGGVVRGVDGAAVAGATVTLSDGTTSRVLTTANEPLGRFSFTNVSPGAFTVTASLPGSSQAVQLVTVIADVDRVLDIRLSAQASATGQVLLQGQSTATTPPPTTAAPTTTTAPPDTTIVDTTTPNTGATTTAATTPTTPATTPTTPAATTPPGAYAPYAGATVRLYLATDFPGPPSSAIASTVTDLNGMYRFNALDAPQNYVVAVFQTSASPEPLDSILIVSQPGAQLTVPTFQIPVLF